MITHRKMSALARATRELLTTDPIGLPLMWRGRSGRPLLRDFALKASLGSDAELRNASRPELASLIAEWAANQHPTAPPLAVKTAVMAGWDRRSSALDGSGVEPTQGDEVYQAGALRYTVGKRLGAGASGTTFLATQPTETKSYVLKFARGVDPTVEGTLRNELQKTSALRVAGAVFYFEIGRDPVLGLYLVSEFVDGFPFRDMGYRSPDPTKRARQLDIFARSLARTLDALHRAGVIHRDVQPDNVLISSAAIRSRTAEHTVLIDFGLAGQLSTNSDGTATDYGYRQRHPYYGAPEAEHGNPVGPGADQWSLAATLLSTYLPAGRFAAAFRDHGPDRLEVVARLLDDGETQALLGSREDALRRALSADPDYRFSSCGDFVDAMLCAAP